MLIEVLQGYFKNIHPKILERYPKLEVLAQATLTYAQHQLKDSSSLASDRQFVDSQTSIKATFLHLQKTTQGKSGSSGSVFFEGKVAYKRTKASFFSSNCLLALIQHHPEMQHPFLALPIKSESDQNHSYVTMRHVTGDEFLHFVDPFYETN